MEFNLQLAALGNILLAALLGGLIGLEREIADKPAGLRTHMLVGVSAALLITLGLYLIDTFGEVEYVRTDPIRIVEAVVVGIGFLGAGTIIHREGGGVRGLTTSASIFAVAAIGIGTALGLYPLAIGVTLAILFINYIVNQWEKWLERRLDGGSSS